MRARACVRCQSKRRLPFHLCSQSEIRGRSTALHSLQPNITLSLCWAHFWRGTPFLPNKPNGNDTQHLISSTSFLLLLLLFLNNRNCPAFWTLTSNFCLPPKDSYCNFFQKPLFFFLWIPESFSTGRARSCYRKPNTHARVFGVRELTRNKTTTIRGALFQLHAFESRAFVGWGGLSFTREMPQLSGGGGGGDPELCATDEMIPFKDEGDPHKEQIFAEISHSEEEGDLAEIKSSLVNETEISPNSNSHDVSSTPPNAREAPARTRSKLQSSRCSGVTICLQNWEPCWCFISPCSVRVCVRMV